MHTWTVYDRAAARTVGKPKLVPNALDASTVGCSMGIGDASALALHSGSVSLHMSAL